MVIKSDSRREPFDRKKLWAAISRACVKRPVSTETMEKIVSEVENEISDYIMEVPSSVIGQKTLKKLIFILLETKLNQVRIPICKNSDIFFK